jgi:hypothetical protein
MAQRYALALLELASTDTPVMYEYASHCFFQRFLSQSLLSVYGDCLQSLFQLHAVALGSWIFPVERQTVALLTSPSVGGGRSSVAAATVVPASASAPAGGCSDVASGEGGDAELEEHAAAPTTSRDDVSARRVVESERVNGTSM